MSLEGLIPVINKLQDVFNTISHDSPVQLPQIVVVGTQSAGKSSVLESVVGRDFLPRGAGTVTRRPLVLQLSQIKKDHLEYVKNGKKEWATFLGDKDSPAATYTDFEQVREHIVRVTDAVAGANNSIVDKPINLKIFSPTVVNLTLVDLPGLIKVASGDQPKNIEELLTNMIRPYIDNPKSIILAVTPANTDMATSDALKLAKEADPKGDRTLAVITKLDLMDPGTDARKVFSGTVIPVKLGIIGVVNRSQKDINEKKHIEECLKDEKAFLMAKYSDIAHEHGTRYLASELNKLLMKHIRTCLPDVKEQVNQQIAKHQQKLEALGEALPEGDLTDFLLRMLLEFADAYHRTVFGSGDDTDTDELHGGSKINGEIFYGSFDRALLDVEPLGGLEKEKIIRALRKAPGLNPALFVPEDAFTELVKMQIDRLKAPSLQCAEAVREEMISVLQHCGKAIEVKLLRFPKLRERINSVMHDVLAGRYTLTVNQVKTLLKMHTTFINTKHPNFSDFAKRLIEAKEGAEREPEVVDTVGSFGQPALAVIAKGVASVVSSGKKAALTISAAKAAASTGRGSNGSDETDTSQEEFWEDVSPRENEECLLLEKLIEKYFLIVRENIQDAVPKAIVCCMISDIHKAVQGELIKKVFNQDNSVALLYESEDITVRRTALTAMFEALQRASRIISEVRELNV